MNISARECPHCRARIEPSLAICPACGRGSEAWRFHSGRWWVTRGTENFFLKGDRWVRFDAGPPGPQVNRRGAFQLRRPQRKTVLLGLGAFLAIGLIAELNPPTGPERLRDRTASSIASPSPSPSPSPEPSPPPTTVQVPKFVGLSRGDAIALADEAGLEVSSTLEASKKKAGIVLGQSPSAGSDIFEGGTVRLEVAKPLPRIPNVVGKSRTRAVNLLKSKGFTVSLKKKASDASKGTVLSQSRTGLAQPGSKVVLVIAKPRPQPTGGGGGGNCTPGYSPCLPPASDYDCAGGSGNGPEYTGYVTVTGSDPYDLDSDGDGAGCE